MYCCIHVLIYYNLLCVAGVVHGIRCYRCGQYNEGVGSITPCINYTAQMLTDCSATDEWCIVSTHYYYFFFRSNFQTTMRDLPIIAGLRQKNCYTEKKCEKYTPCTTKDFSRIRPETRERDLSQESLVKR